MQLLHVLSVSIIFASLATAQNSSSATSGTATTASNNYGLNPNTVDLATRQYWCQQQTAQCPLICGDINNNNAATSQNRCDAASLSFQCVCSNGQTPNATEYTQTIPFFQCTEAGTQCVNACNPGNPTCQANCRNRAKCGATEPKKPNITSTTSASSTSSATVTAGANINGAGTGAASTFSPSAGLAALTCLFAFGMAMLA